MKARGGSGSIAPNILALCSTWNPVARPLPLQAGRQTSSLYAPQTAWKFSRRQKPVAPAGKYRKSRPLGSLATIPTEPSLLRTDTLIGLMSTVNYEPAVPPNGTYCTLHSNVRAGMFAVAVSVAPNYLIRSS
jgi:hypothetical protein